MARLVDADRVRVVQRNPLSGCIPAGTEWLLRYHRAGGVDFRRFQEEFDRESNGTGGGNTFGSIKQDVEARHSHITLEHENFGQGDGVKKLDRVETLVRTNVPCLLALLLPNGYFHAVPVIEIDADAIRVRWMHHAQNEDQTVQLFRGDIARWHAQSAGGHDLLWVKGVSKPSAKLIGSS